ncbi:MAG: DUF4175 family protein [Candidatus Nitrohelix vancouverensis]|uniref:DUF4175 family protein n=1 Tax=Candidatus Nitrohelix vancouverensis TaxID=2705534 RepID=A0A7T0C2T6_9BACT|nr:MAG: DUF4175 family protein [Candidatus Nitrohelix vancouverensis]
MEARHAINHFIARVRRKRAAVFSVAGLQYAVAWLGLFLISGATLAYFYPAALHPPYGFAAAFALPLLFIFYRFFIRGAWSHFSGSDAALLVEKNQQTLNNDLVNSWQLQKRLDDPESNRAVSLDFIRELLARTQDSLKDLSPDDFVNSRPVRQSRAVFASVLALIGALYFGAPGFFSTSYQQWSSPQVAEAPAGSPSSGAPLDADAHGASYKLDNLELHLQFPAYTGLPGKRIANSDGAVKALPGTEVKIRAEITPAPRAVELAVNEEDHFAMKQVGESAVQGAFLTRNEGHYQILAKDSKGKKHRLTEKFPIELEKDKSPRIILFLSNPKPVYFETDKIKIFYECSDDYGVSQVDLVAHINGEIYRETIKKYKLSEKAPQGDHTWDLGALGLQSGDEVQYYIEAQDNDNVTGPNLGQSETYSFTIFDSNREREDLVALQDQLADTLLALLANNLVEGVTLVSSPKGPLKWKPLFSQNVDRMIEPIGLAQSILERAKAITDFPQSYLNLMENLANGMMRLRQEHIAALTEMQNNIHKPTPVSITPTEHESLYDRLVRRLETDLLFLIRMTNRQKMDQVMDLENQLETLAEELKKEFEAIRDQEKSVDSSALRSKIDKMKQTLQKMMEQLARQTQSLPDEFLNRNAFKNMNPENFSAALDRISQLANEGKMDQAMKELERLSKDIQSMANQLEQAENQMENMVDQQLMEQLDQSIDSLDSLENKQKQLVDQGAKINQSLRDAQSESFSSEMDEFFKELKELVNQVQSLLKGDLNFLSSHPTMQSLEKLLDRHAAAQEFLRKMEKEVVESSLKGDVTQQFQELNKARRKLSEVEGDIDSLRVRQFHEFRQSLPQIERQYDSLEELAELSDFKEFNEEFKNVYPEIYRWQNNLRMSRDRKEDIADRIDEDLKSINHLNNEISKKLGSLGKKMKDSFQSRLTPQDNQQLQEMAKQQQQLSQEAREMEQQFSEMNQKNPSIPSQLSKMMSQTERFMEQSSRRMQEPDVSGSISSGNSALSSLKQTKDMLKQMRDAGQQMGQNGRRQSPMKLGTGRSRDSRRGGSSRMQKEKVLLPSEDQYKAPKAFREEILNAMKKSTPESYEKRVMEYYKELVK